MSTGRALSEQPGDRGNGVAWPVELEYLATTARMRDTVGIWDILNTLWRRRWLIGAVIASIMMATVVVLFQITPSYRAQALLIIEGRSPNFTSPVNVSFGQLADPESIQSEMVILRSPTLAKKVIDRLGLQQMPEFNPALRESGSLVAVWAEFQRLAEKGIESLFGQSYRQRSVIAAASSSGQQTGAVGANVINAFLDNLEVSVQGSSRVISLAFSSHDPDVAAKVPNTLAEIYFQEQRQSKREIAELDAAILDEQVAALRKEVDAEDQAVETYRKQSGLLRSEQAVPLTNQRIGDASRQLAQARASRWQAEARLNQLRELERVPGEIDSSSELMNSALIPFLREQEAELRRERARMSVRYGPKHAQMLSLEEGIREIQARLKAEKSRVIEGYRNDVVVARAREATLQNYFDRVEADVTESNEKEIKLRSLEREADSDRALLATMMARLKESRQQRAIDAQQADGRVVSLADIPSQAAFPKVGAMMALALVGSTLLSMLIVLVSEQRDRGFSSRREVEETMGMRVLGSVPKLEVFRKLGSRPGSHPSQDQSNVVLKESMRSIYESILLSDRENAPRSLLITSSVADEGKTAVAVGLARMEALTGSNVLVMDADLRRPDIHHAFGATESPGLVDLVTGEVDLETVLRRDQVCGAWYMTAGRPASDPLTILTSEAFDEILAKLVARFDLIIIDSPPSQMFLDARILSTKIEKTLLVVRCGETPQQVVQDTLKRHAESGARFTGVVLSMTDGKAEPQYG